MADTQMKTRIHDALKQSYFNGSDDLVDVSDGPDDTVHLVIVSRKFDGQRMIQKNDLIWSLLTTHLTPEVWQQVTLTIATSPEEIKAA